MVEFYYKHDADGYHLFEGDTLIKSCGQVIAILFDRDILLKHGSVDTVKKVHETYCTKVGAEFLPNLFMFTGVLPVEELNKVISISGYVPKEMCEFMKLPKA